MSKKILYQSPSKNLVIFTSTKDANDESSSKEDGASKPVGTNEITIVAKKTPCPSKKKDNASLISRINPCSFLFNNCKKTKEKSEASKPPTPKKECNENVNSAKTKKQKKPDGDDTNKRNKKKPDGDDTNDRNPKTKERKTDSEEFEDGKDVIQLNKNQPKADERISHPDKISVTSSAARAGPRDFDSTSSESDKAEKVYMVSTMSGKRTKASSEDRISVEEDANVAETVFKQETYVKTRISDSAKVDQVFQVAVFARPNGEHEDVVDIYPVSAAKREPSSIKLSISSNEGKSLKLPGELAAKDFLQNFSNILEISDLSLRRKHFDRLVKALSSHSVLSSVGRLEAKPNPFWRSWIKKKKAEGNGLEKGKPSNWSSAVTAKYRVVSEPYFNHSFYHYTVKSNLGLTFEPHKLYKYGEKGSGFQSRGEPQDFYKLRDQCLSNGTLFEDPEFPATDSSLFFSRRPDRHFEWKRPGEIADNPQFFVEGFSRFDVQQGELGDCWLLAAVANLTLYRRLFLQIVPDDQSYEENYAGIFHFRFWQYGRWVDVVIDDRLPTYRGELVFLHSTEANEFWSALLEKAYAKLYGSYEALKGGSTCEAMEDFTGGVTEMYEMNACPPNLFKIIMKAYERWSLMGCSLEPDPNVLEAQTPEGLIRGHAYSITKVQYVNIATPRVTGRIPLLRLRNPWGNESEWNGAWSDHSPEWQYISEQDKEELGLTFDADGEFWMSFKDFQMYFNRLEICNLNPDSLTEDELPEGRNKKWVMSVFEGEWVRGVTAGGCRNFLQTFWNNPQYRVTLEEVDEGEDENECTVIVALMQKNRRALRSGGGDLLTIGFAIYHLPQPDRVPKPLDLNFFKYNASVARSPSFINLREVSCRFKLPPGTYCIVPSTFDPNEEGEFLLRIFSEHQNHMEENDQPLGLAEQPMVKEQSPKRFASESDIIMKLFKEVAGEDNEIDWKELKQILDRYTQKETEKGFSKDVCRSMIAMLDTDRTGKLNSEEFMKLFLIVRSWKVVFKKYDKNNNGTLEGFELRSALNSAGYSLNNHILNVLMHRYGSKGSKIEFDDFIMCAVKLKIMMDVFKEMAGSGKDNATFTLDQWIELTLSA